MAEQLTGDAQAAAEGMLGEARTRSEQLLSDLGYSRRAFDHELLECRN
jgi:hypothetical protein